MTWDGTENAQRRNVVEVRRQRVAAMLGTRQTYEQIAEALGCSDSTVGRDVQGIRGQWRVLYAETYEELRAEEMAKLDMMERSVLAEHDEHGRVRLLAVDRELQIMQRRAQLMGLDRPVKIQAQVTHRSRDELDAKIEELVRSARRAG